MEKVGPAAERVNERQVDQTEFYNRHLGEFRSFWSQRALEAEKMPDDRVRALELRPRAVKRIMRAAVEETLNAKSQAISQAAAPAATTFEHRPHLHAAASAQGAEVRNESAGRNQVPGHQHGVPADAWNTKRGDQDREVLPIKDEACFVMARACELFAMDLAKRSELVLEDGKRARGAKAGHSRSQLKTSDVVSAADSTDYCDFLVDLVQVADRERSEDADRE